MTYFDIEQSCATLVCDTEIPDRATYLGLIELVFVRTKKNDSHAVENATP